MPSSHTIILHHELGNHFAIKPWNKCYVFHVQIHDTTSNLGFFIRHTNLQNVYEAHQIRLIQITKLS